MGILKQLEVTGFSEYDWRFDRGVPLRVATCIKKDNSQSSFEGRASMRPLLREIPRKENDCALRNLRDLDALMLSELKHLQLFWG